MSTKVQTEEDPFEGMEVDIPFDDSPSEMPPDTTITAKVFLEDRSFDPPVAVHLEFLAPASETIVLLRAIREYAKVGEYVGHVGFGPRPASAKAAASAAAEDKHFCSKCGAESTWKEGVSKTSGKPYAGWFCTADNKHIDWGKGK